MLVSISRLALPPIILIAALGIYRLALVPPQPPRLVEGRDKPWQIPPRYDWPEVVTDQQLVDVLARMQPPDGPAATNRILHALRLWGPNVRFGDREALSGQRMLGYFLDDKQFQELAGERQAALFRITNGRIGVRNWEASDETNRITSSYHTNDILATLGETGASLDTVISTRDGDTTVRSMLQTALDDFNLDQFEYEWSIISYGRYVYPQTSWRNKFGERIGIDQLVDELTSHPLPYGPCNGLHRLEAMVVLNRAHEESQADAGTSSMSQRTRRRMLQHLKNVSSLLVLAQTDDGYWTRRWPAGMAAREDTGAPMADRILVTGHHLEWLALAPEEVLPPRETIVRASQWLVHAILEVDEKTLKNSYGPFSHGARALCLWRSLHPHNAWPKISIPVATKRATASP